MTPKLAEIMAASVVGAARVEAQAALQRRDSSDEDTLEDETIAHRLGIKAPVTVSRCVQLDRSDLGDHRLGPGPVTGVATIRSLTVVRVAEMVLELDLE